MNLFKLGFRNIGRNKKRTLINTLTISAVVLVIILFDILVEGQWNDVIENYVRMGIGHIQIHKKGYDRESERLPLNILISNYPEVNRRISTTPGIKDIYPRLKAGGLISFRGKESPVVINGVDLELEAKIELITEKNVEGVIPLEGEYGILIGMELANLLKLTIGDIIFLYSRTAFETHNVIDLEVTGIYSIGFSYYEKSNVFIPVDILKGFLGTSSVSEMTIILKDPALVDAETDTLEKKLTGTGTEVFPYSHYIPEVQNIAGMQQGAMVFIRFILLLLALFGIVNIMMISVWERKKEIGTMRAIGYSKSQITRIFLYEGLWTGILGSLLGCLFAFGVGSLLENLGIPIPKQALVGFNLPMSNRIYGKMLPQFFIRAFLMGTIITVLATLPSTVRASFLTIVKALREY